jgi:hypothetical protein
VTLADLVRDLERRRAEAERVQATAPLATVYGEMLDLLRQVDGTERLTGYVNTHEAARMLGLAPKTVMNWCRQGRIIGAMKTSGSNGGVWRVPVASIGRINDSHETSRLWRAEG